MPSSRRPGPLGAGHNDDIHDGTTNRQASPHGSPLGTRAQAVEGPTTHSMAGAPATASRAVIPMLREWSRGPEVVKLQQLLNARLNPPPGLKVDGIFGPQTRAVVINFQGIHSLLIDGVVGRRTWHALLFRGVATTQVARPTAVPTSASAPTSIPAGFAPAVPSAAANAVLTWPIQDKFKEMLLRTGPKLPASMRREFEAFLSPTNLAIMAGTLVAWAASHAFGLGEAADVLLFVTGVYFLGRAVFDVAAELSGCLVGTSTAATTQDLDAAATHLANAISLMGVLAFIALLEKVGRAKGRTAEKAAAEQAVVERAAAEQAAAEQAAVERAAAERAAAEKAAAEKATAEKAAADKAAAEKAAAEKAAAEEAAAEAKARVTRKAVDDLGPLKGRTQAEIEADLVKQGYTGVPANSGGKVFTKDLGNGQTMAVRLDPPTVRNPPKGFADEVAHAHKESVPTSEVQNGNYSNGPQVKKFNDAGNPATAPADVHIPTQ